MPAKKKKPAKGKAYRTKPETVSTGGVDEEGRPLRADAYVVRVQGLAAGPDATPEAAQAGHEHAVRMLPEALLALFEPGPWYQAGPEGVRLGETPPESARVAPPELDLPSPRSPLGLMLSSARARPGQSKGGRGRSRKFKPARDELDNLARELGFDKGDLPPKAADMLSAEAAKRGRVRGASVSSCRTAIKRVRKC
jgi:hypothetical protein